MQPIYDEYGQAVDADCVRYKGGLGLRLGSIFGAVFTFLALLFLGSGATVTASVCGVCLMACAITMFVSYDDYQHRIVNVKRTKRLWERRRKQIAHCQGTTPDRLLTQADMYPAAHASTQPAVPAKATPAAQTKPEGTPAPATPAGQAQQAAGVMYQGAPILDWIPRLSKAKRENELDYALTIARGCADAMTKAAKSDPTLAESYFVEQVAIIERKRKNYEAEAQAVSSWLDLDIDEPAYKRVGLQKRLAKAREMAAKVKGEDASEHTRQWKELVAKEKELLVGVTREERSPVPPSTPRESTMARRNFVATRRNVRAREFVCVDFETANKTKVSACQIALVKVKDGVIVDRYTSLIAPPAPYDGFIFTDLHGIGPADVANAPTWADIAPTVGAFVAGAPTWAHNAAFDAEVWDSLDAHFGTDTLPERFYCTWKTGQKLLPGLPNYKLPTLTKACAPGFVLDHHKADSDAEACAHIVMALATR